jgi:altronate dehydratase large subunit
LRQTEKIPKPTFRGFYRPDGLVGIRNKLAVIYASGLMKFMSDEIALSVPNAISIGLSNLRKTKSNNETKTLIGLGRNPNLGAVLLVGSNNAEVPVSKVADGISKSGKPLKILDTSKLRGTRDGIRQGRILARVLSKKIVNEKRSVENMQNLTIGVKCGGSDATSALTANPAVGLVSDMIIDYKGKVLSSELTEMTGCENMVRRRTQNQELANQVINAIQAAVEEFEARFGEKHSMMSPGNITGGLTTIEEKSFGAVMKTGHRPLVGFITPGAYPKRPGWYVVDGLVAKNIRHFGLESDDEPIDFAAAGAQMTFFTTGRGSADGNLVAPLIKVCANPETYKRMSEDMDFNAGLVLEGKESLETASKKLFDLAIRVASGELTRSEVLGHQEGGMIFGGTPTLVMDKSTVSN